VIDVEQDTGFWNTVFACEGNNLPIRRKEIPLLKVFFISGVAFGRTQDARFEAWRSSVHAGANDLRQRSRLRE